MSSSIDLRVETRFSISEAGPGYKASPMGLVAFHVLLKDTSEEWMLSNAWASRRSILLFLTPNVYV